jgi:hypothetical protein
MPDPHRRRFQFRERSVQRISRNVPRSNVRDGENRQQVRLGPRRRLPPDLCPDEDEVRLPGIK